jgi:hypothetical protein
MQFPKIVGMYFISPIVAIATYLDAYWMAAIDGWRFAKGGILPRIGHFFAFFCLSLSWAAFITFASFAFSASVIFRNLQSKQFPGLVIALDG